MAAVKDTYYFPHDSNARGDPRLVSFCQEHKNSGYACYFMTIEVLREQADYRLPKMFKTSLYTAWRAYGDDLNEQKVEAVYNFMVMLGLLQENEFFIWSDSLIRRMQKLENSRVAMSEAGRKGAEKRWHGTLMPPHSDPNGSKVKQSKVKQSKLLRQPVDNSQVRFQMKTEVWEGQTFESIKSKVIQMKHLGMDEVQIKDHFKGHIIPESVVDKAIGKSF